MPALLALIILFSGGAFVSSAKADSCWWHNGSLMRLVASGNQRWFYYERPRAGLAVQPGTLLFNGTNRNGYYVGTARVFSKYCPGTPLAYAVEGPVSPDQLGVFMRGNREIHNRCRPTGRWTTDNLEFRYSHRC
ncbi:hypothetical protein [uncultured Cohaesibacter sp.]|uniref:hypothetical protein n=1 Tax=uncultured Cohaesibacter sp. TaxID=1002546 RepID=UPI002931F435|nr:hypothetical protein [uncultured Cohaesibacter sp.]